MRHFQGPEISGGGGAGQGDGKPRAQETKGIPFWTPRIGNHEGALIERVLESNYLNDGEFVRRFEQALAARLGCRYVVAVTSGTSALFLALAALEIGPGDEVIVPDITFIATANAVTLTGARAVLADVDPRTLNLDPAAALRKVTPRTRAIIPVHVSGRGADMDSILEIARQHGLHVVEDAAEAFMSRKSGRFLGTLGIAACLSFSPNKTITTGQGGAVLTSDERVHQRLRELKDQGRPVRGTGGDDVHPTLGYNFKFTDLQAAVGLGQLNYLDARLTRMRDIYRWYERDLAGVAGISLPGFDLEHGESPQWTDAIVERRDELDEFLAEGDIHCRRFWRPLHTHATYRAPDAEFPQSTRTSCRALWLPSAFTLTEDDVAVVAKRVKRFLSGKTPAQPVASSDPSRAVAPSKIERPSPTATIKLSILIPVRNEGLNLSVMLKLLPAVVEVPHEVIVIHDTPDDDSVPVVRRMQVDHANLRLLHNTLGTGVINALRAGVAAANGEYVLIFAADEVGPVLAIDQMLELMDSGCEFVSCTRYANGGRRLGGSPMGYILSRAANWMFHRLAKTALTDSTTGIKMFRRSLFDDLSLDAEPVGWAVAFEMAIKAELAGLKLGEVPIISIDRLYGGRSTFRPWPWMREYMRWFVWGVPRLRATGRNRRPEVARGAAR